MVIIWIFTDKGFISAVAYNASKDKTPDMSKRELRRLGRSPMLLRARVKDDLEQVRPFYAQLKIQDSKTADYQFRAFVPRKAWVAFAANAAEQIDYDSHFKEVAAKRSPPAKDRHAAYMGVWSQMEKLQPNPAYGGYTKYSGATGYSGANDLCVARYLPNTKTGEAVSDIPGKYCNYKYGHAGKHEFEVQMRLPLGSANSTVASTKEGTPRPKVLGSSSTNSFHTSPQLKCTHKQHRFEDGVWQGAFNTFPSAAWYTCYHYGSNGGPSTVGCQKHSTHEFRQGKWHGSFDTGSGAWFPCSDFIGTKAVAQLQPPLDEDGDQPREAGAPDCDTLDGMINALQRVTTDEVPVDPVTPDICYELWSYANDTYGGHWTLTTKEVADLLVELIEDEALIQYRDEYLEALDRMGYQVADPDSGLTEVTLPGTNNQDDLAGTEPAENPETAVAVESEVSP